MRVIAGGKQLGTMSGSVITLGAAVNDELTIGESVAMAVDGDLTDDSGLDGEIILARVEYDDPATDGTDFEVAEWTYSSTAGTLTRVASGTHFSSDGVSAVTFTSTVVVYGVLDRNVAVEDGWVRNYDAWSYATASTFTVASSAIADKFNVGMKLKLTNSGSEKFFYVAAVSGTTITVAAGDDYSLVSGAITGTYISHESNPQDFPQWFNYSPTYTNLTAGNGTENYRFMCVGGICHYSGELVFGSTTSIDANNPWWSLPVAHTFGSTHAAGGVCTLRDGTSNHYFGGVRFPATTALSLDAQLASGTYAAKANIQANVPFTWATTDQIYFTVTYPIL